MALAYLRPQDSQKVGKRRRLARQRAPWSVRQFAGRQLRDRNIVFAILVISNFVVIINGSRVAPKWRRLDRRDRPQD
jgi:hypothetical protein